MTLMPMETDDVRHATAVSAVPSGTTVLSAAIFWTFLGEFSPPRLRARWDDENSWASKAGAVFTDHSSGSQNGGDIVEWHNFRYVSGLTYVTQQFRYAAKWECYLERRWRVRFERKVDCDCAKKMIDRIKQDKRLWYITGLKDCRNYARTWYRRASGCVEHVEP